MYSYFKFSILHVYCNTRQGKHCFSLVVIICMVDSDCMFLNILLNAAHFHKIQCLVKSTKSSVNYINKIMLMHQQLYNFVMSTQYPTV